MPGFPLVQFEGLSLLSAVLVTMGLAREWRISWIVGVPWLALLTAAYFAVARARRAV
jgi:AAT family amino acid transporter